MFNSLWHCSSNWTGESDGHPPTSNTSKADAWVKPVTAQHKENQAGVQGLMRPWWGAVVNKDCSDYHSTGESEGRTPHLYHQQGRPLPLPYHQQGRPLPLGKVRVEPPISTTSKVDPYHCHTTSKADPYHYHTTSKADPYHWAKWGSTPHFYHQQGRPLPLGKMRVNPPSLPPARQTLTTGQSEDRPPSLPPARQTLTTGQSEDRPPSLPPARQTLTTGQSEDRPPSLPPARQTLTTGPPKGGHQ